jgi:hypothetical protein
LAVVHLAAGTDHRGHGGIDDDVARHVEIGDAVVGVDHGDGRAGRVGGGDVGLDRGLLGGGELLHLLDEVAEAVVQVDAEFGEGGGVLGEEVLEEDPDGVAEEDGVGDLHHGGLEVEEKRTPSALALGDLLLVEGDEGGLAHLGGVEDLAGLEGRLFLQHLDGAVGGDELDRTVVAAGTVTDFSFEKKSSLPMVTTEVFESGDHLPHGVRVGAGVVLDGLRGAAVGVAFAEDGVDGGALDLVVAGLGVLFGVGLGVVGIGPAPRNHGPGARRWLPSAAGRRR